MNQDQDQNTLGIASRSDTRKVSPRISITIVCDIVAVLDILVLGISGLLNYAAALQPPWNDIDTRYVVAVVIGGVISGLVFRWFDLYSIQNISSLRPRLVLVVEGWLVTFAVLMAMAYFLKISDSFSRVWALSWLLSGALLLLLMRYAIWQQFAVWVRNGRFVERIVIVGAGENGQRLAQELAQQKIATLSIVGFADDRTTRLPISVEGYPILGNIDHLIQLIRDGLVDQVIIALPWSAEHRLQDLIYRLALTPAHIRLAPDFAGLLYSDRPFVYQAGIAMLRVLDRPISGWMYVVKRIEDVMLAVVALLGLWPLLMGIWIAIRLSSPGPALFRQPRYGFNNAVIHVLKFRTMHAAMADVDGE